MKSYNLYLENIVNDGDAPAAWSRKTLLTFHEYTKENPEDKSGGEIDKKIKPRKSKKVSLKV